jgi:hypothetical protein
MKEDISVVKTVKFRTGLVSLEKSQSYAQNSRRGSEVFNTENNYYKSK